MIRGSVLRKMLPGTVCGSCGPGGTAGACGAQRAREAGKRIEKASGRKGFNMGGRG
jgi:hypothetical protein